LNLAVADDGDVDRAAGTRRRDAAHPRSEAGRGQTPAAAVTDQDAQRSCRS
jgi:hypothetical protein